MQRDPEAGAWIRRGDPAAPDGFEGGLLELLPSLRRYSRSLTRSDADGDDLLQAAVEQALANRERWRGANLRAWAYAIMTNIYRNGLRRTRRFPPADLEEAHDVAAPETGVDPIARRRLLAALDMLAPEHRAVLMLVVVEGFSYAETAEALGTPIGTVMSRLARAREQLARRFESANVIPLRRTE